MGAGVGFHKPKSECKHPMGSRDKKSRLAKSVYRVAISLMLQDDENLDDFVEELNQRETANRRGGKRSRRKHFSDSILGTPAKVSSRRRESTEEDADARSHGGRKRESLSLRTIAHNLQTLSQQMRTVGLTINEVVDVVTWGQPDKTVAVLLLYTWGCIYPHFFLLYPIVFVMHATSMNYLRKHPAIEKPSMYIKNNLQQDDWDDGLGPRLKDTYSNSIHGVFGFLWEDEARAVAERTELDELGELANYPEDAFEKSGLDELVRILERGGDDEESGDEDDGDTDEPQETSSVGYMTSIARNMLGIQTMTSSLLASVEDVQDEIESSIGFIDEGRSTVLFYKLFLLTVVGSVLGKHIPWRAIFILAGWVALILSHPSRESILRQLLGQSQGGGRAAPDAAAASSAIRKSVVIDEPVYAREVEMFELEKQNLFDPKEYEPYGFSNTVFSIGEASRCRGKKPKAVFSLAEVSPPVAHGAIGSGGTWEFFIGEEWEVDDADRWFGGCCCREEMYFDAGWVYDSTGEFRRRRWTRKAMMRS